MTTEWHLSGSWVHYELALSRHMFMLFLISGISCLGFVWLIFSPLPLSVTSSLQMSLHLKLISGFCQVDFLSQWAEWFISKYYYLLLFTSMVEKSAMTYICLNPSITMPVGAQSDSVAVCFVRAQQISQRIIPESFFGYAINCSGLHIIIIIGCESL